MSVYTALFDQYRITIFSNGYILLQSLPNRIVINGNNFMDSKIKDTIKNNLRVYREKGVKITLRFNISNKYTKEEIIQAVKLSKEYARTVSISLLYPVVCNKEIGNAIYNLSLKLIAQKTIVKISRALPLCIFTNKQRVYLKNNCNLKGQCVLPSESIVINPDGDTIQPCVELNIARSLSELKGSSPKELLAEKIEELKNMNRFMCSQCDLFLNKKCCGGCLSYK